MTLHVGVGGAQKIAGVISVGVGGTYKPVQLISVGVGGAWKVGYSAVSAAAVDVSYSASGFSASGTVSSPSQVVLTGSRGSGNYAYSYEHISTSSGNTPTAFSGASTDSPRFTAIVQDGTPSVSVWRGTVTDVTYGASATDDFTVTLEWVNIS